MNVIFHETQRVFEQGGVVLWGMVLMTVILYTMLASSWFGLFTAKRQVADLECAEYSLSRRQIVREMTVFELEQLAWVERRIPVLGVLVAAAPLAGLLGTVVGMLATFSGLATQVAAKPIDGISAGISQAMITTQAGLFMAIPGAILLGLLRSQVTGVKGRLGQLMHRQLASVSALSAEGGKA